MRISFHQLWKKGNLLCRFIFDGISAKFFCFHIFLDMRLWFSILWSYEKALTWLSQVNAFRERRALALTLNDTKTAVNKLHRMVNIMVGIVIAVIWLLILGIATSKFLLFLSSQLLLVAFIFGNTCKTVFESIIFLFVIHPFDVGDRCEVDGVQVCKLMHMNCITFSWI